MKKRKLKIITTVLLTVTLLASVLSFSANALEMNDNGTLDTYNQFNVSYGSDKTGVISFDNGGYYHYATYYPNSLSSHPFHKKSNFTTPSTVMYTYSYVTDDLKTQAIDSSITIKYHTTSKIIMDYSIKVTPTKDGKLSLFTGYRYSDQSTYNAFSNETLNLSTLYAIIPTTYFDETADQYKLSVIVCGEPFYTEGTYYYSYTYSLPAFEDYTVNGSYIYFNNTVVPREDTTVYCTGFATTETPVPEETFWLWDLQVPTIHLSAFRNTLDFYTGSEHKHALENALSKAKEDWNAEEISRWEQWISSKDTDTPYMQGYNKGYDEGTLNGIKQATTLETALDKIGETITQSVNIFGENKVMILGTSLATILATAIGALVIIWVVNKVT